MFGIFSETVIGVEITSSALRVAALARKGGATAVLAAVTESLPAGLVNENFLFQNVREPEKLSSFLAQAFQRASRQRPRRVGMSLPDSVFRVQTLEFDELPARKADRDRLVRWRLEKGAAFDMANTVMRYQARRRQDRGFSVLASVAKQDVLSQYEGLITGLGCEPWAVGPSSFHALNFYHPAILSRGISSFALAWIEESAYTLIAVERDGPRFYRFKELRPGPADDLKGRFLRELDDSLHFYTHMDRQQPSEIGHLFLAGEFTALPALAEELRGAASLAVDVLAPAAAVPAGGAPAEGAMAAAFGAGESV